MKTLVAWIGAILLPVIGWVAAIPVFKSAEQYRISDEVRNHALGSFVDLEDGKVRYELVGDDTAQTVVLVHGFSVPAYVWGPTFRDLSAAGFRVLRFDLFGRGLSDRPRERYNREFYVRHVRELLDSLRITQPVTLAGLSMGGAVVAAFSAEHPDRVENVILVDPVTKPSDAAPLTWPFVGNWIAHTSWLHEAPERQLEDFYRPERFSSWPEFYREQMIFRGFGRSLLSTLRHFMSRDPMPDYQTLAGQHKPVLLIWGEHDRTTPVADSERLREVLNPEFFLVPEAGHLPHYERADLVSPKIIEFLKK